MFNLYSRPAFRILQIFSLVTLSCSPAFAATIRVVESTAVIISGNTLVTVLDEASPGYSSSLNSDNLGSYRWEFTNRTGAAINNLFLLAFFDADIDFLNGFSNEYGEFISLALPPGAPPSAIGASGWEIDEPGYVFGDIYVNLFDGLLDNTNAITAASSNDTSLALLFAPGNLPAGTTLRATFFLSSTPTDGLAQFDVGSNSAFYWNGFADMVGPVSPPPTAIPEPSTSAQVAATALLFLIWATHSRSCGKFGRVR